MTIDHTEAEKRRYFRNLMLPEVGAAGQKRFQAAGAAVVGAGGIGSAALYYLAAAGVGRVAIIDGDAVELSNLQRQILHGVRDLGKPKADSAREALLALNPHLGVQALNVRVHKGNILEILHGYDIILDASDNFETRLLLGDYCWKARTPLVSAAAAGFHGLLLVMAPGPGNPCYRCLLPQPPAPAPEEGILGAVAGVMGCLQAVEALKLILGRKSELTRRLLAYDGLKGRFQSLARPQRPDCPLCGEKTQ
jgi:adenylyltransferase/sulfurtransferase